MKRARRLSPATLPLPTPRQVCVFAFDLLYLNGTSLLQQPLLARREALHAAFDAVPAQFAFAEAADVMDEDGIAELLQKAIKGNCEGLMVKTLETDATCPQHSVLYRTTLHYTTICYSTPRARNIV